MSEKIVQLNEDVIKDQINELVRGSLEETLKELLEKEGVQSKENRYKAKRLVCKTVRNLRQMPSPAMEVEAEQWLIRTTPAKSCTHCERWSAGGEGPDTGSVDSVFSEGREKRRV